MSDNVIVTNKGKSFECPKGTPLKTVASYFQKDYSYPIVLAVKDYKLKELHHTVMQSGEIGFETIGDLAGHQAYQRSAFLLFIKSLRDVAGHGRIKRFKVEFALGAGYYCTVLGNVDLTEEFLSRVKDRMQELVREDLPIVKESFPVEEVREWCKTQDLPDKAKLFHYRMSSNVNMYSLDGFMDYYYGFMVPSTGYLKYFDLIPYEKGVILQMPTRLEPETVPPFEDRPGLFKTLYRATEWGEMLGVETVGDLNDCIVSGRINELILTQEALQERRIAEIATEIVEKKKRFIMVAGPSSSGKTSFSYRLSIQLRAHGMKPHAIALDNYFLERSQTPRDSEGKLDYECLEALDVAGFNRDMSDLLSGKEVKMPTYNFITGEREYKGNTLQMHSDDVLVIEGIHGLNNKLSQSLPDESKYRIYISALTALNVDEHNRISTTDGRLLRRLVRDARTRGASAAHTLGMWESVRRGERQYIFPFQENADVMFNSALIYEIPVLKQFAEPLLFSIPKEAPEYREALRLLKFLQYFLGISTEDLPKNSLVREFVGGSYFPV
ncbi:MAG: nucleoside kinase [Lachnospiraceae bacterium]|nr:nucleoside kinase [Lachnospiraceae bacterium]